MAAGVGKTMVSEQDEDTATRLETAAARLHPANQQIQPLNEPWPLVLIVTVTGICGFVGLLVASHYFPDQTNILRTGALIWFLILGGLRAALVRKRRIAPTSQGHLVD